LSVGLLTTRTVYVSTALAGGPH